MSKGDVDSYKWPWTLTPIPFKVEFNIVGPQLTLGFRNKKGWIVNN